MRDAEDAIGVPANLRVSASGLAPPPPLPAGEGEDSQCATPALDAQPKRGFLIPLPSGEGLGVGRSSMSDAEDKLNVQEKLIDFASGFSPPPPLPAIRNHLFGT